MAKNEIIKRDLLEVLKDLPELCYARKMDDGSPVILKRGVQGYWSARPGTDPFAMNDRMGVNVAQEEAMVAGSICGFEVPGADPLNYTEPTMYAKLEAKRLVDKQDFAQDAKIQQLGERYCSMPNGGARLTLGADGTIGDGYAVLAKFSAKPEALKALWRAGFEPDGDTWKWVGKEVAA